MQMSQICTVRWKGRKQEQEQEEFKMWWRMIMINQAPTHSMESRSLEWKDLELSFRAVRAHQLPAGIVKS